MRNLELVLALKKFFIFLHQIFWAPLFRNKWLSWIDLLLGPLFYSWEYKGSFVTMALEHILKSGITTLLDAFCLFGITLVIQGLLRFPVHFRGLGDCCFVFLIFLLLGRMSLEFWMGITLSVDSCYVTFLGRHDQILFTLSKTPMTDQKKNYSTQT